MEKSAFFSPHKTQELKRQAIAEFEKGVDETYKIYAKKSSEADLNVGKTKIPNLSKRTSVAGLTEILLKDL